MYEYAGIGKPAVSIEILDCEEKRKNKNLKLVFFVIYFLINFKKAKKKSEFSIFCESYFLQFIYK